MSALVAFTGRSLETERPVPFGSSIVHTRSGEVLLRATNAVAREFDPSSHAEVRAIRLACKKLKSISLAGYTLYADIDRVVYGATIEDANRHCRQIHIHAGEVVERSDMRCKIDGPLLREQCYALFTHPNMLRAFRAWPTRKRNTQDSKTAKVK